MIPYEIISIISLIVRIITILLCIITLILMANNNEKWIKSGFILLIFVVIYAFLSEY